MIIARMLAEYAGKLKYTDLPEDVVHEVKRRLIDSIGCVIGAFNSEPAKIAREIAILTKGSSSVIGTNIKTSPDLAAFANGVAIRYLDYNDTYLSKEPAHPSDNISACLAVAEAFQKSGKDLITAIALAYEVQCRLCDAASLRARGWDHVTYGAFSATLAAAKLMNLNIKKTVHALGLAGVANIALRQTRVGELSMWKGCAFANAARNAVFAANLARLGMTGPAPVFEGEKGFMKLVSGSFELEGFGGKKRPFKILDTYIKFYPAEYHSQSAIEAALQLRKKIVGQGFSLANDIKSIEIKTFGAAYEIIGSCPERWNPKTRETADHSLPYCAAVALMDGEVSLNQFSEKRFKDKKLHNVMQKVKVVRDKGLTKQYPEAMPNHIIIITKNGREFSGKIEYPKGHPKNPMTDREVEEKFKTLSQGLISARNIDKILSILWRLEELNNLRKLFSTLSTGGRGKV
ncbi:MAG: 2-methylcitrate dehydratase [Deltaproteobacteria bacterium RIFCSPLOWO2_12_FULL_43_16]|nr:MAG: 2-methylcitrate dehydratase [Deltaproteobacteria bacterium RIFCSPHIGHO2_02_FULL_43_33]OGQ37422.1 MAG: 2-methylcitrate dehydratase [Deltaproteobacteria bacterium RIFCSPLOWO2_01_FULL_42_9]OGQ57946.1 MAG: 2-methylcitrate dehydratase [Deltaproteobacteria bacterium RIFCSPLOWO2_12_FULL_43_16]